MVVYAAEKCGSGVFADVLGQEEPPAWVFVKKIRYVVDESGNDYQRSLGSLILI